MDSNNNQAVLSSYSSGGDLLSHAINPMTEEFQFSTISGLLRDQVTKNPHKTCVISVHENISKSFIEFYSDVRSLAQFLRTDLNLALRDHVAIWSYNCYSFLVTQYACGHAGLTLALLDSNWKVLELKRAIEQIKPKLLLMPSATSDQNKLNNFTDIFESLTTQLKEPMATLALEEVQALNTRLSKREVYDMNMNVIQSDYNQLLNISDTDKFERPNCIANYLIAFTSGSTGKPSPVPTTHFAVINNALAAQTITTFGPDVTFCLAVPMAHAFGGVCLSSAVGVFGSTMVIAGYKYSPNMVVGSIQNHKCNLLAAVPTMLSDLVNVISNNPRIGLPSLKVIFCGAATLSKKLSDSIRKYLPDLKGVRCHYGMTEMSSIVSGPLIHEHNWNANVLTVGAPIKGSEIKLLAIDSDETVVIGYQGIVHVKSPYRTNGYMDDEARTMSLFTHDGWYNTGDIGMMDNHGNLTIKGRVKELINRGGAKVHPAQIEEIIVSHPLVKWASVVGVPDERLGEDICAWVGLNTTDTSDLVVHENNLRAHLTVNISRMKMPRYFLFTNNPPMTGSGKILKPELVSMAIKRLCLCENN